MSPGTGASRPRPAGCGSLHDGGMADPELSTRRKVLVGGLVFVAFPLTLLCVIEGASSFVLLGRDLWRAEDMIQQLHAEHDTLLGWIQAPDVELQDAYGPGRRLVTNSQRFRAEGPVPARRPDGRYRIICAGDSFTLGYGVSNEATWCHLLEDSDPAIETVNMGQGGYGPDQVYLQYLRDGLPLEHDVLLFSFITDDFRRVAFDTFEGHPKPLLRIRDGDLVLDNVPVPRDPTAGWRERYAAVVRDLRFVQFFERVVPSRQRRPWDTVDDLGEEVAAVCEYIVRDLAAIGAREDRLVVLICLPDPHDRESEHSRNWRRRMASAADRADVVFLDLVDEIRRLPLTRPGAFFRSGHYNELGNEWVAETLSRLLHDLPQFRRGLDAARAARADSR